MSRSATQHTTHTAHTSQAQTSQAHTGQPARGATVTGVTQEKIAKRAYELWLKRGCRHGCDMQDWLDAEAEVKAEVVKTVPTGKTAAAHYR